MRLQAFNLFVKLGSKRAVAGQMSLAESTVFKLALRDNWTEKAKRFVDKSTTPSARSMLPDVKEHLAQLLVSIQAARARVFLLLTQNAVIPTYRDLVALGQLEKDLLAAAGEKPDIQSVALTIQQIVKNGVLAAGGQTVDVSTDGA